MKKLEMITKAEQMMEKIDDLPTIPTVATQVLQLLDKPDVMTHPLDISTLIYEELR